MQSDIIDKIKFIGLSILKDYQYTLKMDFEISNIYKIYIVDNRYIGLNGSCFTIGDVVNQRENIIFSIYCGKNTKKNTIFNEKLLIGSYVNFSLPIDGLLKF